MVVEVRAIGAYNVCTNWMISNHPYTTEWMIQYGNKMGIQYGKVPAGTFDEVFESSSETVWESINATAENLPSTSIPATFQIGLNESIQYTNPTTGTKTLWTNANATEHFSEYVMRFGEESWTIGRLVYGDSNDSFKEWADMMMWDGTVTTELIPEEQLFTKVIGLSQQEYKLLRYKVRVQNQILGAVETMSYTALLNYPKTLAQYKASMEIALGKQLSDLEFERLWTDQYNAMSTASDYAHYNITKAAIFATDYPPFTFDVIEWIKRKLANQQTGGSDSTREDMAGWLGDATIRTNNGKVAFSPDDYMADLDADNVMNIMKTQNISHSEAEAIYFKRLENGETRAEIFLSHTSLDFVISEVLSRLNINSLEELKTIEPEAYAFIVSLEHGSNELEVVP